MKTPRNQEESSSTLTKLLFTFLILSFVFLGGNFITSSFPQTILVNQETIIEFNDNLLSFQDIDSSGANITINGLQTSANSNDVIALGGRQSVILTGNQVTSNENTFFEGLLTIPTKLNHIILFEQSQVSIPDTAKQLSIKFMDEEIILVAKGNDVFSVQTGENTYDIQISDITYITDTNNKGLFKVWHRDNNYIISLVGYYGEEPLIVSVLE